jgi:hypothetical protein
MTPRCAVLAVALLAAGPAAAPAAAQDRTRQYLGLAKATLEQPITPAELEAALLSPAGVRDIAALFEKAIAAGVMVGGGAVIPELGGEATLYRGQLRFVEYPDALHPVIRRMIDLRTDPKALLDLLTGSVEGQQILARTGGLHAHLYQMTTKTPTDDQRRVLDRILASAVAVHFKAWSVTPEQQHAMIEKHDWRGRYVGFWHLHPPVQTVGGSGQGFEPSMEDMNVAVEKGQFLTIVFQPDGFDVYDLEPLATAREAVLSKARVIRYRSPEWAKRFGTGTRAGRAALPAPSRP